MWLFEKKCKVEWKKKFKHLWNVLVMHKNSGNDNFWLFKKKKSSQSVKKFDSER